jgi:hypothetical protein
MPCKALLMKLAAARPAVVALTLMLTLPTPALAMLVLQVVPWTTSPRAGAPPLRRPLPQPMAAALPTMLSFINVSRC